MYSKACIVYNTILYAGNLLIVRVDFRNSHHKNQMVIMGGDAMLISLTIVIMSLYISNHIFYTLNIYNFIYLFIYYVSFSFTTL